MENFPGIFIMASNFAQNLDPAAFRRFTFKLHFDYLDIDGKLHEKAAMTGGIKIQSFL